MLRALPVHLVAMASLNAFAVFIPVQIWPGLPDLNRGLIQGFTALYVLAWLILLAANALRRGSDEEVWEVSGRT